MSFPLFGATPAEVCPAVSTGHMRAPPILRNVNSAIGTFPAQSNFSRLTHDIGKIEQAAPR